MMIGELFVLAGGYCVTRNDFMSRRMILSHSDVADNADFSRGVLMSRRMILCHADIADNADFFSRGEVMSRGMILCHADIADDADFFPVESSASSASSA